MPSYNVQEIDGSLEVCVTLTGDTAIPVRITFSAMDGTATGRHVFCICISVFCTIYHFWIYLHTHTCVLSKLLSKNFFSANNDFRLPTEDIMFIGDGPQNECIDIEILDDLALEDTESFFVLIQTNNTRGVIVNPNSTVVFIVGRDGEF